MMLHSSRSERSIPTESSPKRWRRGGGFVTGLALSLSGLVLGVNAAATSVLRAAGAPLPNEPVWAAAIRGGAGCVLVVAGFTLMVLCTRGVDAHERTPAEHLVQLAVAAEADDILCGCCGAANDHLARYCDQCGRRL